MAHSTSNPACRGEAAAFEREARQHRTGVLRELVDFLRCNKKWWLTPILAVILLAGALVFLGGTGAAPFIYTLF